MYSNSHKTAEKLLGSYLCRKVGKKVLKILINEVEVYDGHDDLASHASKGKTKRTEIMFGPPGYWYVYLCYGVHWMLNLVTREQGYPAAILIRGAIAEGACPPSRTVGSRRGQKIDGPGKLTKYVKIDKSLNTKKAGEESGLWIEWRRKQISGKIKKSPRIGVDYAGPIWSKKHWRYVLIQ